MTVFSHKEQEMQERRWLAGISHKEQEMQEGRYSWREEFELESGGGDLL